MATPVLFDAEITITATPFGGGARRPGQRTPGQYSHGCPPTRAGTARAGPGMQWATHANNKQQTCKQRPKDK